MPEGPDPRGGGALARLVGTPDTFLRERFTRSPHHEPGADADGFADLLSLDDVDELVTASGLRTPSFRLVRQGRTLPVNRVTRRARIGSRPVSDLIDVAAVHREFADGATIVLQGLHRSWPAVARLCRSLEDELTHPVQANAYLTPPVAQGLNLHEDPHDVLVLQTHGTKRWVVHPGDGAGVWDLTLSSGDVLYLPAGTRHAAQTTEEASLHLTIGVRTTGWRDLVRRAVEDALDQADLEGGLPAGWAARPRRLEDELASHLTRIGTTLTEKAEAWAATAAADGARSFWEARTPELAGGLLDLLEADELTDATALRIRTPAAWRFGRRDGELVLTADGHELSMPESLEPALEEMLAAGTFRPEQLDATIDRSSRGTLCRRLLREGLLAIDRAPAGQGD
jgi:bifunctional lysine-specific demethylase and histidyl-hydroxylase NO66